MGWMHIRVLHSELVEHWQRVVGSQGPRSPWLGPTEPITQGCQRAGLESLRGGGSMGGGASRQVWLLKGFLASHPLSFPSRGNGRRHVSVFWTRPSQCHILGARIQNISAVTTGPFIQSVLRSRFSVHGLGEG